MQGSLCQNGEGAMVEGLDFFWFLPTFLRHQFPSPEWMAGLSPVFEKLFSDLVLTGEKNL